MGDGSFGFTAAELETVSRVGGNINVILFNNGCYGWIKAASTYGMGGDYADFSTNFKEVDYAKIAEGFGLNAYTVEGPDDLVPTLREALNQGEPTFIDLKVLPENELAPPVPSWIRRARELGIRHVE